MTSDEANAKAYEIIAIGLPESYIGGPTIETMNKKAISLQRLIGMSIIDAYKLGRASTSHEISRLSKQLRDYEQIKIGLESIAKRWGDEDFDPLEAIDELLKL